MTDLAHPHLTDTDTDGMAAPIGVRRGPASSAEVGRRRTLAVFGGLAVAVLAGVELGHLLGGRADDSDRSLMMLLRFMAVLKCLGALGAAALLRWRLTSPIGRPLAAGYVVAVGAMATASGLIWSLGAIAAGAVLFHAGLLAFLCLAWRDSGIPSHRSSRR